MRSLANSSDEEFGRSKPSKPWGIEDIRDIMPWGQPDNSETK